jgi:hypothetical protein
MRRFKLVLAALALVLSMFAAFSGPAMADNLNCRDAWGNWIRCDGRFYAPVNNNWWGNNWWGKNNLNNCLFLPAVTIC